MSKKEKTQADVITLSNRFSCWRDKYQWILYDFGKSRLNEEGEPKKLPNSIGNKTYYPRLTQMMDHMIQVAPEDVNNMGSILTEICKLQTQILEVLEGHLEPLGMTPADATNKLGGKREDTTTAVQTIIQDFENTHRGK